MALRSTTGGIAGFGFGRSGEAQAPAVMRFR
jgi:hypothetical protein